MSTFVDWAIPASYEIRVSGPDSGPYCFWIEVHDDGLVDYWDEEGGLRRRGRVDESCPLRVGHKAPTILLEGGGYLLLAGKITAIFMFYDGHAPGGRVQSYYLLEQLGQQRLPFF